MAYSDEIRTYAQSLMLNGMSQADAIDDVQNVYGVLISSSTMSTWSRMVMLTEEEQLRAAQMRADAADRAAIRVGTASYLLQNKLDAAVTEEESFLNAIKTINDLSDHGLIDPDAASDAVDTIRDYISFTARDLSAIIKESSGQQAQITVEGDSTPSCVQITFADQGVDSG